MILSNGSVLPTQLTTLADTTPLFADASYYTANYLQLQGQWAAYGHLYRSQLWVGIVVRKLAGGTARMPFDVKRQGDANSSVPESGPLADLMMKPNPHLSGHRLWNWTASTRKVYGEAFWLKFRDGTGRPRELYPVHPSNMILRRDQNGPFWVYSTGTRNVSQLPPIPFEDVVHFSSYNPDNTSRGISNLEGLRMTLLNEDAARRANSSFWAKGARPSVVLTHPNNVSLSAQERLLAGWNATQSGADNMGGTALLEEGITPHVMQLNSEEMQYIQSRKLNREEVAAAYDVPQNAVGILDHATFSNVTEMMRSLYRETLAPDFVEYESVVNHQLVPDFDKTGEVFTRFNMDEVLRGDFETRATAVGSLIERGVLTPNEARPMFGQAPYPGTDADRLYANAAMVPLGTPAERISITEAVPPTASQAGEAQSVADSAQAIAATSPIKALIREILAEMKQLPAPIVVEQDPPPVFSVRAVKARIFRKSVKEQRAALVAEHESAMKAFFDRQRPKMTKAFDAANWDPDLADLLNTLGQATAETIGQRVAKDLGGAYTLDELSSWLDGNAKATAGAINQTTANQIQTAIDNAEANGEDPETAVSDMFDSQMQSRAEQIAWTRVAVVAGFSTVDAGKQNGGLTKTWTLGGGAPRPSHARMSGETVPIHELFSNSMNAPGDPAGGVDEVAGCTCSCEINTE